MKRARIVSFLAYQPATRIDEGRPEELQALEELGAELVEAGWRISTGTFSPGEQALIRGASHVDVASLIVTGVGFGRGLTPPAGQVARVVHSRREGRRRQRSGERPLPYSELEPVAARVHRRWSGLTRPRRELLARNVGILATPWGKARVLVSWTGARPRPLTCPAEHGLALGEELGIRTLDLRRATQARPERFREAVWRALEPTRVVEREVLEDLRWAA